jgi:hypothetical protein
MSEVSAERFIWVICTLNMLKLMTCTEFDTLFNVLLVSKLIMTTRYSWNTAIGGVMHQ